MPTQNQQIIPGSPEWEAICKNCGICCLVKCPTLEGKVYLTNVRCSHLDPKNHKCDCYANRQSVCSTCGNLNHKTLKTEYLVPLSCPYVQTFVKGVKKTNIPNIDWENTISETELKQPNKSLGITELLKHIIHGSSRLFEYNPTLNTKLQINLNLILKRTQNAR